MGSRSVGFLRSGGAFVPRLPSGFRAFGLASVPTGFVGPLGVFGAEADPPFSRALESGPLRFPVPSRRPLPFPGSLGGRVRFGSLVCLRARAASAFLVPSGVPLGPLGWGGVRALFRFQLVCVCVCACGVRGVVRGGAVCGPLALVPLPSLPGPSVAVRRFLIFFVSVAILTEDLVAAPRQGAPH